MTTTSAIAIGFAAHDPATQPCPACGVTWVKVPKKRRTWEKRHRTDCEYLAWLDAQQARQEVAS